MTPKESASGGSPAAKTTAKPPAKYLRINEQATYIGVHPKSIGRIARNDPTFPPEIKLTEGVHGVRVRSVAALEEWIASKPLKLFGQVGQPSPSTNITPIDQVQRGRGRPRRSKDPPQ